MRTTRTGLGIVIALGMVLASCSDNDDASSPDTSADTPVSSTAPSPDSESTTTSPEDAILTSSLRCDPLDEHACLLPWPNNAFTTLDETSPTGRRIDIAADATPTNVDGVHIDVTDQNRGDGFSPGSAILTVVPGLSFEETGLADSTAIERSLDPAAPVVLLDADTGERLAYWAELDAQSSDPNRQVLMIRPATSLPEGHRIIVAMRSMLDASGNEIPRSTAFQAAIDGDPEPLERARAFRELFAELDDAGIETDDLYLAWDFTVASEQSLSERLLHIRNEAYAALAGEAPAHTIVDQADVGGVRTVNGTFEVPNYLTGDGSTGNTFDLGTDGLPVRNSEQPTLEVLFRCEIPTNPAAPVPMIVYGHGLLGTRNEVASLAPIAAIGQGAACATDWAGMSTDDLLTVGAALNDLSLFPQIADRLQQGLLNVQFLGRLMNHPEGLAADPAFQTASGTPIVQVGSTQFIGNSQGGVLGGAASAISTEWSRAVLGVPGLNFSLLLTRSSQWERFRVFADAAYVDPIDRVLAQQIIQLLWDRGENNGYVQHLTSDPYIGVTAKQVLLIEAIGDHQVSNASTHVLARTIGALTHDPVYDASRGVDGIFGVDAIEAYPASGSALMVWDFGTPFSPPDNLAPRPPAFGTDPHNAAAQESRVLQQVLAFLLTGEIIDVCGPAACVGTPLN